VIRTRNISNWTTTLWLLWEVSNPIALLEA